jgi:putative hydrolase of the HAD superfamily
MSWQAVIFDLGGVVLGSPPQAFRAYEAEIGLPTNFLNRMIVTNGPKGSWQRLERGEIDMASFLVAFEGEARLAGAAISSVELMTRVATVSVPRPAMLHAIKLIREAGLKTAALTNNWPTDEPSPHIAPLRAMFDAFVESAVTGLRKPDPRIYELVCKQVGVLPGEAVFLDDIGANLKPARAMGMHTIKVDTEDQALAELQLVLGFALR